MPDAVAAVATPAAPAAAPAAPPPPAPAESPAGATPPNGAEKAESAAAVAPPPPKPAEEYVFDLVVDGKTEKMPASRAKVLLQREISAGRRFNEAAQMRKEAEAQLARLKEDPWAVLKEIGVDVDEVAKKRVLTTFEEQQLTPEQKELRKALADVERLKGEQKSMAEKAHQERVREETERSQKEYGEKFLDALKKIGQPLGANSGWAVQRMATLELANLEQGLNLTADELAQAVKDDIAEEHKSVLAGLEGDALLDYLGEDTWKSVVKAASARYKMQLAPKPPESAPPPESVPAPPPPKKDPPRAMTRDEQVFNGLRQILAE